MTTLHELEKLLEREQTYFARRGAELQWRLWPPAASWTLREIENRLSITLPAAYAAFLTITGGLWLTLSILTLNLAANRLTMLSD